MLHPRTSGQIDHTSGKWQLRIQGTTKKERIYQDFSNGCPMLMMINLSWRYGEIGACFRRTVFPIKQAGMLKRAFPTRLNEINTQQRVVAIAAAVACTWMASVACHGTSKLTDAQAVHDPRAANCWLKLETSRMVHGAEDRASEATPMRDSSALVPVQIGQMAKMVVIQATSALYVCKGIIVCDVVCFTRTRSRSVAVRSCI